MNFMQRLILLAAFLGCFAFLFAWAAGRSAKATTAEPGEITPLVFWMATAESDELIVIRGDQVLSGKELRALAFRLNTNPLISHELAR